MDQRILQIIQKHPELKPEFEEIYPELKDGEDERIRENIIQFFKDAANSKTRVVYSNTFAEWASYLEKQKEQKSIFFIPKFRVGDKIISTKNPHLTYNILEVGNINELGNPEYKVEIFQDGKPSVMEKHTIHYMECCKVDEWGKLVDQKPAEWSEEDSRILYNVIAYVGYAAGQRGDKDDEFKEANSWLNSLSERFNPQPNQEWSEEDEYVIDKVIEWAKIVNPTSTIFEKIPKEQFIKRLKSLHPQPEKNWKRYIWNVNMRFDYGALVKYDDHYGFEIVTSGGKPKREVNGEYIFLKDICSTSY